MTTIAAMSRKLSNDDRIQTPSITELKDGLESVAQRIARRVKFQGRKLRYGPMLNAIVAEFLRLPEDQQDAMVESGLQLVETLLESDEPRDKMVSSGTSPHQWLVAGGENLVEVEMSARPGRGRRRQPRVESED